MTHRTLHISAIGILLSTFLSGCGAKPANEPAAQSPTSAAGGYTVAFRIEPDPPAGGKDKTVHVALQDASGKPVADAQIHMTLTMPAMPEMKMPEMTNSADLKWTGSDYTGPVQVMMAGGWNVVVEVKRGSEVLTIYKTKLQAH